MRTLCVVLASTHVAQSTLANLLRPTDTQVLVFSPGGEVDEAVRATLQNAEFLDVRRRYSTVLPLAREQFTRYVAEWPDRYHAGRRSFKRWLRRDSLALWWLLELSQKNPESSPVFSTYCIAEILRRELANGAFSRVVMIGGEAFTVQVLGQVCHQAGITLVSHGVLRRWQDTLPGMLLSRARSAAGAFLRRRLARRQVSAVPSARAADAPGRIAFHTWYPSQWADWQGERRDRYFVDLPDALAARGAEVVYACSLTGLSRSGLNQAGLKLDGVPDEMRRRFVWIEAGVPWRDVARIYFDLGPWLRFIWRQVSDPSLRRSLATGLEVDLSPLLLHELSLSLAVGLPSYLLLAQQMRLFALRYRPTHLLTILETYCYGRAVTWGTHVAGTGTLVVGLQHSPVNANQLFYRYLPLEVSGPDPLPLPDEFLLHGRLAEKLLREAGVAANRLHRAGAPRFAQLAEYRRRRLTDQAGLRRELGLPAEGRLVLVAGVIWPQETERLIQWAFTAVARGPGGMLLVKPHPMNPDISSLLAKLATEFPTLAWQLVRHHLNALQAVAEVMITGNSTSDVEALAIGCAVIKAVTFDLGSSPLDDFPGCVVEVHNADELATALRVALAAGPPKVQISPVVDWALGPLDDAANERVAQILLPQAGD